MSQVAKIATIINGSKDARIVFKDSLSCINTDEVRFQGFDKDSFDCIIANPPYSVKGFLNTITEHDREQFDLVKFVEDKALDTNNSIECFFIERTKHFLRPNGFVGIVLPSSILSNGNLYIKTRELLFANFNILAIVNLNSRTFGSTGTNTIVLFAQRVKKNSEGLLHTFIENKDYTQYLSWESVDNYIKKQGYDDFAYRAFMQEDELYEVLEKHEFFAEYKRSFKPTPIKKTLQIEWFENSSFFDAHTVITAKDRKEKFEEFYASKEYKKCVEEEHRRQFIAFAKNIESDKLNTYIQIADNGVAILQSPPDKIGNKSNKAQIVKFLGYDWSNRKGDEGIKYVTNKQIAETDDDKTDKNDKDAEVVEAINSIKYIDTTLYNPNDSNDSTKFAYAIRKHIYDQCRKFSFGENKTNLTEDFNGEMSELLSYASLADMMDFSRTEFDKTIKLTADKKIEIVSKWPLKRLDDILVKIDGNQTKIAKEDIKDTGKVPVITQETGNLVAGYCDNALPITDLPLIVFGDHSCTFKYVDFEFVRGADGTQLIKISNQYNTKYIYEFLCSIEVENSGKYERHFKYLKTAKIPLPPIDIQSKIVSECEKVDEEYAKSRMTVEEYKKKIAETMANVKGEMKFIGELCEINTDTIDPTKTPTKEFIYVDIESVSNGEGIFSTSNKIIGKNAPSRARRYAKSKSTLVSTVRPNLKGFAFVEKEIENAVYSTGFAVLKSKSTNMLMDKLIYLSFMYSENLMNQMVEAMPKGQYPSINKADIENFQIPVPSLDEQQRIVSAIETYESEISKAKAVMAGCAEKKKNILEKWLK